MKAISLWQPWASAIPLGLKCYETRSWATAYRGPIAIHAAKRLVKEGLHVKIPLDLFDAGVRVWTDLPLGGIVAIAQLVACTPTDGMDSYLSRLELRMGDYSPGRFAWRLEKIQPVEFVPCRGYQRLWAWTPPAGVIVANGEGTR